MPAEREHNLKGARAYFLAVLCAAFLASERPALALQYKAVHRDPTLIYLTMTGPIVPGDFDRLEALLRTLPQSETGTQVSIAGVIIDSPGGNIIEAEKIAAYVHAAEVPLIVSSGMQCSSACFLLFAAAHRRIMAPDALIGVHSASEGGEESFASMAFTTAFARVATKYGVPPAIIGKMVQTEPRRMAWLSPSDLDPMGVTILAPSSPEAMPIPIPTLTPPSTLATPPKTRSRLQPQPPASPGEPLVFVTPVTGAPGDGRNSLAAALREYLSAHGIKLANRPDKNVYTVRGSVNLGWPSWRRQRIRVDWVVLDPGGKKLGTVSQDNTIPPGSLDGRWGPIAKAAARSAASGVIKLLPR